MALAMPTSKSVFGGRDVQPARSLAPRGGRTTPVRPPRPQSQYRRGVAERAPLEIESAGVGGVVGREGAWKTKIGDDGESGCLRERGARPIGTP